MLQVTRRAVVCGHANQTSLVEECDDGNTVSGDGCSSTCNVEAVAEAEPNEDGTPSTGGSGITRNDFDVGGMLATGNATTQGVISLTAAGVTVRRAALANAGDEDVFAVTNGSMSGMLVQADTFDLNIGINLVRHGDRLGHQRA